MLRDPLKTLMLGALAVIASGALSGCGHVGQDQFDATIAQVRRESREGDEALSRSLGSRVGAVEDKVTGMDGRVASMERDMNALAADFDVMVDRMETAMRFNTPIFFAYDQAELKVDDQEMLNRFSAIIHDYYPGALITVEGFTDASGSPEYNRRLGQRRADAVKEYLVTYGQLRSDRVRSVSYGEDYSRLIEPGVAGPGDAGWQNRRVVLVVDHGEYGLDSVAQGGY